MRPALLSLLPLLAMAALQPLASAFLAHPVRNWARPSRGRCIAASMQQKQQPPPSPSLGPHHRGAASAAAAWSRHRQLKHAAAIVAGAAVSTATLWGELPALAAVKASTQAEARAAALNVKGCLQGVKEMQRAANEGDWAAVASVLASKPFVELEATFLTLVRSNLTAEDKVALGTIKRFGLTADALITLGGLASELRSGGVPVGDDGGGSSDAIEEEGEEGAAEGVNGPEARRYLRLARNALEDIDVIASALIEE